MAPSEFDLRAALRDGEGAGINPDVVMAAGDERRARRRSLVLTTAVVVALVAGGGVGISQLAGGGGDEGSGGTNGGAGGGLGIAVGGAGGGSAYGDQQHRSAAGGASAGNATVPKAAGASLATVGCPAAAPHYLLPGGGGTGSFGGNEPLFSRPVHGIVVCAYHATVDSLDASVRRPARIELAGRTATVVADSLEKASPVPVPRTCPRSEPAYDFAIIATDARGARIEPALDAQVGCTTMVTNGTAVRYAWSPPPDLDRRLLALVPRGVPATATATPSR
jgi:hypothetical protein